MSIPVRIHPLDTDAEAAQRHLDIHRRLDELGASQVELLLRTGGLPNVWGPIICDWLRAKEEHSR